ncbi:YoaK family protein [Nonomuraea turcica]|uniref:YoaK family protein n=1 Tax=Nonomuraea sp. G32 TaxID=3067274 RepID=UPI00273B0EBD|nr:YoaK family protein [Nonomuraea sp. G32]MDP4509681.1 YoaK family protein [Nonomuraea sp. G32]
MSPKEIRPSGDASSGAGPVVSERVAVRLLVVLAAAAGCLDAVCVMRLGGPFASVITGNLVQLGRGVATLDGALAAGATTAVAAYALGVAAASVGLGRVGLGRGGLGRGGAGRGAVGWRRGACLIAVAELALLVCVCAGWLVTGGQPNATVAVLLLAPASAAMGVQSALTIGSGVPGASTTYLTGTLTSLVHAGTGTPLRRAAAGAGTPHGRAAGGAGRLLRRAAGGLGRLAALLCGATVGALLLLVAPLWAPALSAVLVAVVVAIIAISTRGRTEGS